MQVIITRKHTAGSNYDHVFDCPLARAINEQAPELAPVKVLEDYFIDRQNYQHEFDTTAYNRNTCRELKASVLKEIIVNIG